MGPKCRYHASRMKASIEVIIHVLLIQLITGRLLHLEGAIGVTAPVDLLHPR